MTIVNFSATAVRHFGPSTLSSMNLRLKNQGSCHCFTMSKNHQRHQLILQLNLGEDCLSDAQSKDNVNEISFIKVRFSDGLTLSMSNVSVARMVSLLQNVRC